MKSPKALGDLSNTFERYRTNKKLAPESENIRKIIATEGITNLGFLITLRLTSAFGFLDPFKIRRSKAMTVIIQKIRLRVEPKGKTLLVVVAINSPVDKEKRQVAPSQSAEGWDVVLLPDAGMRRMTSASAMKDPKPTATKIVFHPKTSISNPPKGGPMMLPTGKAEFQVPNTRPLCSTGK